MEGKIPALKESIDPIDGRKVRDLKKAECDEWNLELLTSICDPESYEAIKKVRWPQVVREDKILWLGNKAGLFLVKSSYLLSKKDCFESNASPLWGKF